MNQNVLFTKSEVSSKALASFFAWIWNSILRAPLRVWPTPPWFPWHKKGGRLAGGVAEMYSAIAAGKSGLWNLVGMLPDVLRG